MKLRRRDFLAGASALGLTALPGAAKARFRRGSAVVANPNPSPLATSRNVINLNTADALDYAFINMIRVSDSGNSFNPADTFWQTHDFAQFLTADGYLNPAGNTALQAKGGLGGGVRIPNSTEYTGTFTLTWDGDGKFAFLSNTWSVNAGLSSNYTQDSNGVWHNTPGLTPKIVVTCTDCAAGGQLIPWAITQTDPSNTGAYMRNVRFYRTADEARLLSGKHFRTAWLQHFVNLNPGAIRFMNWHGGNACQNGRWENRAKPNLTCFSGPVNWIASPAYSLNTTGGAAYTVANQYVLAAATPTTANPQTTPASMVHQEIVTCNLAQSAVRAGTFTGGGVFRTVTSITQAANGIVTTSAAHGFSTGDTIIHLIPTANGMQQLNKVPVVITVLTTTTYSLNVNTSAFTAFTGTASGCAGQFITLQVGSGNDRTAYPIMFLAPGSYASTFGDGYLAAGQPYTFYFDKTISAFNNSSGVPQFGIWMSRLGGGNTGTFGHNGDIPVEMIASVIVEVNQLSQSQGIANPIHGYVNVPHMALLSMDPDYSSGSNFATNMINVLLNGSTVAGVTYPGIKSINGPSLVVEYSNETWNGSLAQVLWCEVRGIGRWGGAGDLSSMHSLRSTCMVRDIKAAFPSETRFKFTLGGQGGLGHFNGTMNQDRADGTSLYLTDSLVTGGSWGSPISNHDAFNHAAYFDPPDQYLNQFTTGGFWDDRAMYFGADNSGVLSITGSGTAGTKTFTTTAVSNGPPVVGQILVGTGIDNGSDGTFITAVLGTSPNFTLTLSQNLTSTITAGTITSPANGGTNYIGAANQAQALANLTTQLVTGLGGTHNVFSANGYCNPSAPTAGIDSEFAAAMVAYGGKVSIQYEGGNETDPTGPIGAKNVFVTAHYNSTQWRTAQLAYFNARAGLAGAALPALYLDINGNNVGVTEQRWAYSSPDAYGGTTTEGQGFLNNPTWVGLSSRNLALSP